MRSNLAICGVAMVVFLVVAIPTFGHHGSRVSYDLRKELTMVTAYVYQNPHIYVMYDVKSEDGNVVHWGVETYSPIVMTKSGWDRHTLKPGDEVTVTLWPSKVGSSRGFLAKIVLPDGKVTDFENRGPE
jgi:hypothetical protein